MKTYPLFKTHINSELALTNIENVFKSGYLNEGVQVHELTSYLKTRLSSQNLVLLNSCTSAITIALRLAGVETNDDVVSTAMTCVATNEPIVIAGANIIWGDVDPQTGMLSANTIEDAITPFTKAVIIVAWAGTPPTDLDSIYELCDRRGIKLILDAAHAFGAMFNSLPIHEFAHYTCYSFQAIKHFTTGDGGALICKDESDYKRSKRLKWFGLDRDSTKDENGNWRGQQWDVDVTECGYKFNMNNVAAAIGLSQVGHINRNLNLHRKNAAFYDIHFHDVNDNIIKPVVRDRKSISSHWVYTVLYNGHSKNELLARLNSKGIMAGLVHVPNDTYTAFSKFKRDLPGVREFSNSQFSLPCGWWLSTNDIIDIVYELRSTIYDIGDY